MKIFLTGGSGFIGSVTGRRLVEAGHEVLGLARSDPAAGRVRLWGGRVVAGDITADGAWMDVLGECDAVIHAAASVGDFNRRAEYIRINVEGTRRVAGAALAARPDHRQRFVHVSSVAAHSGKGDFDESVPPHRGRHFYQTTKAAAEEVVDEAVARGLDAVLARVAAVYGPGDPHIVTRLLKMARTGRFFVVGDGRQPANLIHVDDVADALIAMLTAGAEPGERFLITDPGSPTVIEATRIGLDALGLEARIVHLPLAAALAAAVLSQGIARLRGTAPQVTLYAIRGISTVNRLHNERTRRRLGWEPRIGFPEGVAQVVAALREEGQIT